MTSSCCLFASPTSLCSRRPNFGCPDSSGTRPPLPLSARVASFLLHPPSVSFLSWITFYKRDRMRSGASGQALLLTVLVEPSPCEGTKYLQHGSSQVLACDITRMAVKFWRLLYISRGDFALFSCFRNCSVPSLLRLVESLCPSVYPDQLLM